MDGAVEDRMDGQQDKTIALSFGFAISKYSISRVFGALPHSWLVLCLIENSEAVLLAEIAMNGVTSVSEWSRLSGWCLF